MELLKDSKDVVKKSKREINKFTCKQVFVMICFLLGSNESRLLPLERSGV